MALRDGDFARARTLAFAGAEGGDVRHFVVAGQACQALEDWPGLERAADALLQAEPDFLPAYVWKGDCYHQRQELRAASSIYATALRRASGQLSPFVAGELNRARRALGDLAQGYLQYIEDYLVARGFPKGRRSPAFQKALDILAGREQVEMGAQRPTLFYFPGLPETEFYDRRQFEWAEGVEAATPEIRTELRGLLADIELFQPYVVSNGTRPNRDYHGLLDSPDWTSSYIVRNGEPVADMVERCPRTAEVISALPQPRISGHSPSIMFSRMTPGAHIVPHHGILNTRLICHLPVIVPDSCRFRVGSQERRWREGELIVFDDTIEHEAWNEGEEERVVLLFDIRRPEISAEDNEAISILLEAVDTYA